MPHDHNLAAELLPKNIIWGEFLGRNLFYGQRRFCFLAWQYPLGVVAIAIVSAPVRAGARGRANRGRAK